MRNKQAFKRGFLRKIASMGITPSEFEYLMEQKSAGYVDAVTNSIKDLVSLVSSGSMMGLAGAGAGGLLLGGGLRTIADSDNEDIDELKTQEITNEYLRTARDIRERLTRAQI